MESTFVMEGNVERFKEPESEEAQIPVKARDVFFSKIILTGPAIHAAPYLVGVGVLLSEQSGRGVKLAIHLNALPMFRMSRTVKVK